MATTHSADAAPGDQLLCALRRETQLLCALRRETELRARAEAEVKKLKARISAIASEADAQRSENTQLHKRVTMLQKKCVTAHNEVTQAKKERRDMADILDAAYGGKY